MPAKPALLPDGARSLASASPGRSVRVDRILFSMLREHCEEVGLREGQIICCRGGAGDGIVVQLPTGRTATISREVARFIEVRELSALVGQLGEGASMLPRESSSASTAA